MLIFGKLICLRQWLKQDIQNEFEEKKKKKIYCV